MKGILILLVLTVVSVHLQLSAAKNNKSPEEGDKFEGDMILTNNQKKMMKKGKVTGKSKRAALIGGRWPNKVVPYVMDSSITSSQTAVSIINQAMAAWSSATCITFVQRTTEVGYINFFRGSGCWSYVGYIGSRQYISLAAGCWYVGTAIHEIGHALGFFHEQSRPDRDTYVTILWQNIKPGYENNFRMYTTYIDSYGQPYDFSSIMHYGNKYFSRNGQNTIESKPPGIPIGQRTSLSTGDITQMNLMYSCNSACNCPSGWLSYQNHCYYISTATTASWYAAKQTCENLNAQLLCLHNYNELIFVWQKIRYTSGTYWVGPNDITTEGTWRCGQSPLDYLIWKYGQPDNNGNQDCGIMATNGYHYDESCTGIINRKYICKKTAC